MCNEVDFTTTADKYFKRKVNQLKVRCPHKGSGCGWVGDLINLEQHTNSCPKRPWQCEYCDFKATYEVYGDHVPLCTNYPIPCPNQCEIVTVPRSNLEKHLSECPLQLVECEFSQAGCKEKVPRRDLVSHVRENAQQHLLSMSLLNLTLTRELREKMEEKDRQIGELQEELKRQGKEIEQRDRQTRQHLQEMKQEGKQSHQQVTQLQQQVKDQRKQSQQQVTQLQRELKEQVKQAQQQVTQLQQQVKEQGKQSQQQVTQLQQEMKEQGKQSQQQVTQLQREVKEQGKQSQQQLKQLEQELKQQNEQQKETRQQLEHIQSHLSGGSYRHDIVLTEFSRKMAGNVEWYSNPFYSQGSKFQLNIDSNGHGEGYGTHVSAFLYLLEGENDDNLHFPIVCDGQLQLLDQQGGHDHRVATFHKGLKKSDRDKHHAISFNFIAHSDLAPKYLKDDCLHFRLYITVTPK